MTFVACQSYWALFPLTSFACKIKLPKLRLWPRAYFEPRNAHVTHVRHQCSPVPAVGEAAGMVQPLALWRPLPAW